MYRKEYIKFYGFLAIGQFGGNLTKNFEEAGYPCVVANSSVEDPYNLPSFYNSSDYFKSNKHTNYFGAHNTDCPQFLEKNDEEFMTTSKGKWYIDKNDL